MKKQFNALCIIGAVMAMAIAAMGGTAKDETLTVAPDTTAVTNTVRFLNGGAAIQRISLAAGTMDAAVTNTFTITSTDGGVDLALYSGSLITGGTATTYPRLVTAAGTNYEAYVVQDVKIICTLNKTNTTAATPRVFIQSR